MRYVMAAFCALLVSACAYSSSSSFADRSSLRPEGFSRVVVVATNFPLGDRQAVEAVVAEKLTMAGVEGIVGVDVLPPTQSFTPKEVESRIASTGADGILILYEQSRETKQTYVPPQIISGGSSSTLGSVRGFGSLYSFDATTTYTAPQIIGGYEVEKPTAKYGAALYDVKQNGLRVWIAEVDTRGNVLAEYSDLAKEAGNAVLNQLKKDGIL